ncbi:MAG: HEAT repeat domain-containing protein [Isosphaeraceae bacterium]
MNESGMEFAVGAVASPKRSDPGPAERFLQVALGTVVALAGCGVLGWVWSIAGNEDRRQALAAVRALDQAGDSSERVEAIRELVRPVVIDGLVAIPPLIRALADPALEVRVESARSLGPAASVAASSGSGDDQAAAAIAALTGALCDREPAVRIAAVYAIGAIAASKNPSGSIHPQTLVGALTAMLADPDALVRGAAIVSLGVAGPVAAPDPPPALIAALDDESRFNRAMSVRTLSRFQHGVDRLIPKLLGALESEQAESQVRGECIEALRQIDPRRIPAAALPALRAGLASRDRRVRVESAALLKRLGLDARPEPAGSVEFPGTEPIGAKPLEPGRPGSDF